MTLELILEIIRNKEGELYLSEDDKEKLDIYIRSLNNTIRLIDKGDKR